MNDMCIKNTFLVSATVFNPNPSINNFGKPKTVQTFSWRIFPSLCPNISPVFINILVKILSLKICLTKKIFC